VSAGITFLAWRVSFQSDEQALRAAFRQITELNARLARATSQLQAIAMAKRSNFEDSVEYQDWAASMSARTLCEISAMPGITRSAAACLGCKRPLGEGHTVECLFAPFVTGVRK
jgi:hypothetical protein